MPRSKHCHLEWCFSMQNQRIADRLTLRCSSWCAGHSGASQTIVFTKKLLTCFRSVAHEGTSTLTCLPDLHNLLELRFANLCFRQNKFSPLPNLLCLFELLNLRIASSNELRLVLSIFALPLLPFGFLLFRLSLVFQTAKRLTNGCNRGLCLLF